MPSSGKCSNAYSVSESFEFAGSTAAAIFRKNYGYSCAGCHCEAVCLEVEAGVRLGVQGYQDIAGTNASFALRAAIAIASDGATATASASATASPTPTASPSAKCYKSSILAL